MPLRSWLAALCAVAVMFAGCAGDIFRQSYRSSLERWPSGELTRLEPFDGTVEIVTSTDMRGDARRMMEHGYLLLGRSKFRSAQIDPAAARQLAKELGASVVFVREQYATSVQESVPFEEWIPARQDTIKQTVIATQGPNAGKVVEQIIVRSMQGEYRTTYVPQTVDYFDYAATFWAKSIPPIFGVMVQRLDDEQRQQLQTNRGVVIAAVIRNSPAFHADLLRNDVIVRFNGTPVTDPDQFFDVVVASEGQTVEVEVVRNGESKTFRDIQLGTD